MSDLFWLTNEQMAHLRAYFPKSHGKPWVDDRRVLSGIDFVNRTRLRPRHAPKDYGPHKTLCNRWKRWRCDGRVRPDDGGADATYLKAHRTASGLWVKKGVSGG